MNVFGKKLISETEKKTLIGTFYRPPNSTPQVLTDIENSIGLVFDTGTSDNVIQGDFNLNILNPQSEKKIVDICQKYNLTQLMDESTNYTEFSSTIIDLIMVSNIHSVYLSGVGEPFLTQDIRCHCPTYCIFKFNKAILKPLTRKIWLYAKGDYDKFRQIVND